MMKKLINNKKLLNVIILIVLIGLSYFTATTFAKYISSLNRSISGTIAKWDVSLAGDNNAPINLIAGNNTQTYSLSVTSTSEVKANYVIEITNVPTGVKAKLDNGSYVSPSSNKITLSNSNTYLPPNSVGTTKNHTITFQAALSTNVISNSNMTLNVIFTQAPVA